MKTTKLFFFMLATCFMFAACSPEEIQEKVDEFTGSAKVTLLNNATSDSTTYSFSMNAATQYTNKNMTISASQTGNGTDRVLLGVGFAGFKADTYEFEIDPSNVLDLIGLGSIDNLSNQNSVILSKSVDNSDFYIAYKGTIHVTEYGAKGEVVAGTFEVSAIHNSQVTDEAALIEILNGQAPYTLKGSFKGKLVIL